jgi:hypothetical protein
MVRAPSKFKKGKTAPPDPAVVKLIDALARLLAREDDARDRSGPQPKSTMRSAECVEVRPEACLKSRTLSVTVQEDEPGSTTKWLVMKVAHQRTGTQ